ncbi:MAG: hypothetical protein O9328_15645, partial [Rhodobacteraceae bacterium]|nr:hypothetical protein [Paracoccaceae bacterium]
GNGNPGLVLFQNADDLIFGEPAALHLWSSRLGQSLPQTGLGAGGNVTDGEDHGERQEMDWLEVAYSATLIPFGVMRQGNCWLLSAGNDLDQPVSAERRVTFLVNKT